MLHVTTPAIEGALERAIAFQRAGNFAQADQLYVQILTAFPRHAEALRWRGLLAAQVGQQAVGIELIQQAVVIRPDLAAAWNDLGTVYLQVNRFAEAVGAFRRGLEILPGFVECMNNLGIALARAGEHGEAAEEFRRVIGLRADFYDAYNGLGMALKDMGRLDEGIEVLEKLVAMKPDHPEGLNNLGNAYKACSRFEEAIGAYRRAIAARPRFVEAFNNMGNAHKDVGRLEEAIGIYREALTLAPGWAEIHNNLANALKDAGRMEEALGAYREALRLRPTLMPAHSNLIYVRQFLAKVDAAEELREALGWDDVHGRPLAAGILPHGNERAVEKRLRVGYVSPDFRTHSVAYFLESLLEGHDRATVEIFCYSDVTREDSVTERLRGKADHWRSMVAVSDAKMAEMVRGDGIDILVDLSGHTAANRLGVFARKPAPVQVSYLGYSGTTGVRAMDYRLTDGWADLVGEGDGFYSEKLVRLPETFICFRPEEGGPAVGALSAARNGYVTFGSFNAMPKMTAEVVGLWAEILRKVAGSRMVIKTRGLGDAGQRERMMGRFAAQGIGAERIELVEKVATTFEHLDFYRRVDIGLDTFPYNGTTTTCEALWMGVPVVTLAGTVHRSRVGVSILNNVGLRELVAGSAEEYVRIAVELAEDVGRLAELRGGLRSRMRGSVLMDGARFARHVEAAYREMWRRWCEGGHG